MISNMNKVGLSIAITFMLLYSACILAPGSQGGKSSLISSLEADYTNVYPKGMSEIKYVTSVPEGDTVQFTWSSDGGDIIGEGSTVIWQAPNEYGDYHVMVTAKDNNGGKNEAVLTLSVVPRPQKSCCGGRR